MPTVPAPPFVAHRGWMARYPENTLTGLRAAVEAGARWLEFDIQMTAWGKLILLHDADFHRTADDPRSLFALSPEDLTTLSVHDPARLGDRFQPEPVASLDQVMSWLATQPQVQAMVEVKQESLDRWGLVPVLQAVERQLAPYRDQAVVISFSLPAMEAAKTAGYRIGWVLTDFAEASLNQARILRPEYLICNYTKLPPKSRLPTGDWQWMLYDIVDIGIAHEWFELGANLIETMDIPAMIKAYNSTV